MQTPYPSMEADTDLPDAPSPPPEIAVLRTQLHRTRQVNAALWARLNHGAVFLGEDGQARTRDATSMQAVLEAENAQYRDQIAHLERRCRELGQTNAELWKRVHNAEARLALPLRRRVGQWLRRHGLRP
nr:hypothetical protein [uncultured Celeribacter sp.]